MNWTPEKEAQLKRLCSEGLTYENIGLALGLTKNAVHQKAVRMGIDNGNLPSNRRGGEKFTLGGVERTARSLTDDEALTLLHWHENERRSFAWVAIRFCRPVWEVKRIYDDIMRDLAESEAA